MKKNKTPLSYRVRLEDLIKGQFNANPNLVRVISTRRNIYVVEFYDQNNLYRRTIYPRNGRSVPLIKDKKKSEKAIIVRKKKTL